MPKPPNAKRLLRFPWAALVSLSIVAGCAELIGLEQGELQQPDTTATSTDTQGTGAVDGTIMRCALSCISPNDTPELLAGAQDSPRGIAIDANNVYWTTYGDNATPTGAVYKMPKLP